LSAVTGAPHIGHMIAKAAGAPKVSAILGPTNTGTTFFAIERMLAHKSGMIGLPLRLLAREVYDRVVRLRGANEVALITGEEKVLPKAARFYICTVEAMPLEIPVACLVVDEIQLCADPERGHVFTDRLLNAPGVAGGPSPRGGDPRRAPPRLPPPSASPPPRRFSPPPATPAPNTPPPLPRRSAVVGFSAEDVYGIAEIVRRQRGGAAVVLGA